jgi:hypothetical protein
VGCAQTELRPPAPFPIPDTLLTLEAESPEDAAEITRLTPVAFEALSPLQRWGGLRVPTRIVIVPDHGALEARAHHADLSWLRAWGRFDVVYLQSPRTWQGAWGPSLPALRQILTHELSHCLMFQAAADREEWSRREIPLWFREGFASWTAHEENKRLSREALAKELQARPTLDPLGDGEAIYRTDQPLVYAAAHWAFARLVATGDDRVRALLAAMRHGWSFAVAFAQVYGEEPATFEARTLTALRAGEKEGDAEPRRTSAVTGH